ncbi:MAG: lamin tail domain-containing protein [Candidatus Aenigmarchaeota archaeon]|nr:lamin tail domain-containing protein [Candidatus Aenigmarchaeota archaeon]
MGKVFILLFITLLLLVSGCTTNPDTGNVVETTKLTVPGNSQQSTSQETIEELHKEFEEFEKSQTGNLTSAEQNKTQEESIAEKTEEEENIPPQNITISEEKAENESLQKQCPSCEDNNTCTKDFCSEETDYECRHEAIIPCCGNSECEEAENRTSCSQDCSCTLQCGTCETLDNESCSCLPKEECLPDGCCPENCTYLEDSDCPKPSAVFSEIQYNVPGVDDNHEWIEVYNNGTLAIDLTKWVFEETKPNHAINNITDETDIIPGSYAVIAENTTQFLEDYPEYSGIIFDSSWDSLSNSGELLLLRIGKNGEIADSISYNNTWGGDSSGFSLEKIDLNGPNTEQNWNESIVEKGTPGQKNSIST